MMLVSLCTASLVLLQMGASLFQVMTESRAVDTYADHLRTFQSAQASLDDTVAAVRRATRSAGGFPGESDADADGVLDEVELTTQSVAGYSAIREALYADGGVVPRHLTSGRFAGLQAFTRSIDVTAEAESPVTGERIRLRERVQIDLVPVFQFAVFAADDLGIGFWPPMTINGKVFTNGTLKLSGFSTLTITDTVHAGGDILHATYAGNQAGDIMLKAADGTLKNMRNTGAALAENGTWLESPDAGWASLSQSRWGGNVRAHVDPVEIPLPENMQPIEIIKPCADTDSADVRAAKFCSQADLLIIDGQLRRPDGSFVTLPLDGNGATINPVSTAFFTDVREGATMQVYDIDVAKLRTSGLSPQNGILYVGSSSATPNVGVRLINAAELPSQSHGYAANGLTVTTHHPLYIKGNYNTVNKQPASIAADAVTVLSGAWSDAQSNAPLASRIASNTQLNAAVMAGRARKEGEPETFDTQLIRFLERWTGKTFTFVGSDTSLWESEEASDRLHPATGEDYYGSPNRVWTFDSTFLASPEALPPGTPRVSVFASTIWQQE
jgi:hypothetical protein